MISYAQVYETIMGHPLNQDCLHTDVEVQEECCLGGIMFEQQPVPQWHCARVKCRACGNVERLKWAEYVQRTGR